MTTQLINVWHKTSYTLSQFLTASVREPETTELEAHGYDRVHSILQLGRGENMPTYLDNYKPNGFVVKMEIWLLSMQCGIVILPFALPLRLYLLSF